MRIDLAAMIRRVRNPRRSKITLRPIEPTASMAADLFQVYKPVILFWQHAAQRIGAAYERALPVRDVAPESGAKYANSMRDAIFDLDSILAAIDGELQQLVLAITPRLREFAVRAEAIHRGKWASAIYSATGVQLDTILGPSDVGDTVGAFVSRNVGLVRSVSDEARGRISDIVLRGYQTRTPLRDVAKEMAGAVDLSRKRALRISVDQASKISARLDQARQEQAGISAFEWRSSHKLHARPWHAARDGKIYDWETRQEVDGSDVIPAGDGPGEPPFCGCRARAVIDLS
jgi:SPP1 gp7 family putative phage head morphogenesis protein